MSRETILIVDDNVINLKVTAAALRSEGYRVQLASTAEQALMTLRTTHPDLMLVDIQLPGMDGLELTRIVKESPATKSIVVVALTAFTGAETEKMAYKAGCDGYLSKPIDTRTLGNRIRVFLNRDAEEAPLPEESAEPEAAPVLPAGLAFSGPDMEGLRRKFLVESSREVRRLLDSIHAGVDAKAAARLFHQWIGSAGVLGYPDIAEQARAAEILLSTPEWTKGDLLQKLDSLAHALTTPLEATETTIPAPILEQVCRKRVALIGFGDEEADKICAALEKARGLARMFSLDEPIDSAPIRDCSVALVHVRPETLASEWLHPESNLPSGLALVLLGTREHILQLHPKVQSRASEYLIDGWQPEEAVMRLSFALSRAEAQRQPDVSAPGNQKPAADSEITIIPCRNGAARADNAAIVIADDDANVLAVVCGSFRNLGMDCRSVADGFEALRAVRETSPRAAVLDVNMPGMNGFEILSIIREENLPVKVVLLTARRQKADILRGFELGADDYVVKPFDPLELAARVKRLL